MSRISALFLGSMLGAVALFPAACTGLDDVVSTGQAVTLPPLETLTPGAVPRIGRRMQVNVVFLGYRQGNGPEQIDDARFRRLLRPFAATPTVDENGNVFSSINFELDFNVVYAPTWYEDALHDYAMQALGARQNPAVQLRSGDAGLIRRTIAVPL